MRSRFCRDVSGRYGITTAPSRSRFLCTCYIEQLLSDPSLSRFLCTCYTEQLLSDYKRHAVDLGKQLERVSSRFRRDVRGRYGITTAPSHCPESTNGLSSEVLTKHYCGCGFQRRVQ